jgi:hypothetical protein
MNRIVVSYAGLERNASSSLQAARVLSICGPDGRQTVLSQSGVDKRGRLWQRYCRVWMYEKPLF